MCKEMGIFSEQEQTGSTPGDGAVIAMQRRQTLTMSTNPPVYKLSSPPYVSPAVSVFCFNLWIVLKY